MGAEGGAGCGALVRGPGKAPWSELRARATGVVCSEFTDCDEQTGGATARGVVAERLETFAGPVLFGFPTGHTARPALTVPLGVNVRVIGGRRPRLVVTEAAVA